VGVGDQLVRSKLSTRDLEVRADASGQVEVKEGALLDVTETFRSAYFGTSIQGSYWLRKGGGTNGDLQANNLAVL
jgi:hypothetical protein